MTLLHTAYFAFLHLQVLMASPLPTIQLMRTLCALVEHAVEAIMWQSQHTRVLQSTTQPFSNLGEYNFLRYFVTFEEDSTAYVAAHDVEELSQRLHSAWLTLSSVFSRHALDEDRVTSNMRKTDLLEAVAAEAARKGLKSCALASCGANEAHPSHFSKCGACKSVVYCCREHQQQVWPAHKAVCKAVRKQQSGA